MKVLIIVGEKLAQLNFDDNTAFEFNTPRQGWMTLKQPERLHVYLNMNFTVGMVPDDYEITR